MQDFRTLCICVLVLRLNNYRIYGEGLANKIKLSHSVTLAAVSSKAVGSAVVDSSFSVAPIIYWSLNCIVVT